MGSRNIKCPHLVIKGLWQKKLEGAFCMFGELGPGRTAPYHTTTNISTPCQHNTNTLPMPHQHQTNTITSPHTNAIISPAYQHHTTGALPCPWVEEQVRILVLHALANLFCPCNMMQAKSPAPPAKLGSGWSTMVLAIHINVFSCFRICRHMDTTAYNHMNHLYWQPALTGGG